TNGVAVQKLSVVDGTHDFSEPAQRFPGRLQGGDQRGDDRACAGPGYPGEPVARRGQRIHGADQSDTADAAALTDQSGRVQNGPLPSKLASKINRLAVQ